jgi:hypothetical protein
MGLLMIKVGGQWVPYAPAGTVVPPAQAGPRSAPWPTMARFGHVSGSQGNGFIMTSDGIAEINIPPGKNIQFYNSTPVLLANFATAFSSVNSWNFGTHPYHGLLGFWHTGAGDNDYVILKRAADTLINGGSLVEIRVGNVARLVLSSSSSNVKSDYRYETNWNGGNNTWGEAGILSNCTGSGTNQSRIAFNSPGVAPQLRAIATDGEAVHCVNNQANGWSPLAASGFSTMSTQTIKKDIRTLRPERERIVVQHPVDSDTVPTPDIMALRPIVFRPRDETISNDTVTEEPRTGVLGREERRERLGLIAEEVQHVIPSAVNHNIHDDALGIDYAQVTVALLDHVQRLTDEVATLRYRIAELENA